MVFLTHSQSPKFKSSDTDIAYEILSAYGRPISYYELIKEVLTRQGFPLDPARISSVLTQINLDTRFAYVGKGEWGLKVWVPTRGSRRLPTITLMHKELAYDDENRKDREEKKLLSDLDDEDFEGELEDEGLDEDVFEKEDEYEEEEPERTVRNAWE